MSASEKPQVRPDAPFREVLERVITNGRYYQKSLKNKRGIRVSMQQQTCPKCHQGVFFIFYSQDTGFYFRCTNCGVSDWIEMLKDPPVMVEKNPAPAHGQK